MKTFFVNTRFELTSHMKDEAGKGRACYRVRSACNCHTQMRNPEMYPHANMRNGVLVIEGNTVVYLFVRCRNCSDSLIKECST